MLTSIMARSAIVLFLCSLSVSAYALADNTAKHPINIAAQDLGSALEQLSRQSGTDLVYRPEQVKGLKTHGAVGELSAQEAVTRLLEGTKLTVSEDSSGALLIAAPLGGGTTSDTPSSGGQTDRPSDRSSLQLAQLDQATAGSQLDAAEQVASKKAELDEVVVTGTHIRGVVASASPTLTISQGDMEQEGDVSLGDMFRKLPANLADVTPAGAVGVGVSAVASQNSQFATGVDLRGLGPQSTLVLVNGLRRPGNIDGQVVDVSAIPLSMIDRVEVLTDGRSAVYGSDAVAGVVNIVTRRTFEGAETSASYGFGKSGGDQTELSQLFGRKTESGGFVAAYDYTHDSPLSVAASAAKPDLSPSGITPIPNDFDLVPGLTRNSGLLNGEYFVTPSVRIFADGMYTQIRNRADLSYSFPAFDFQQIQTYTTRSQQYSGDIGAEISLPRAWQLTATANYGAVDNQERQTSPGVLLGNDTLAKLGSGSIVTDGPLATLGGSTLKSAVGVEWRHESFRNNDIRLNSVLTDLSRSVDAVFAEVYAPILGDQSPQRLDLTIAGRYDHYSDFGGTTNPQIGLVWRPISSLTLRGSFSHAFQAPSLFALGEENGLILAQVPDPAAASGTSPLLAWTGGNSTLQPEKARIWNTGIDFAPTNAPWAKFSASYFEVHYDGRVNVPAQSILAALVNASSYPTLLSRSPTPAQIATAVATGKNFFGNYTGMPVDLATQNLLTLFPNLVFFDGRFQNIAIQTMRGLDFNAGFSVQQQANLWQLSLTGSYLLENEIAITALSSSIGQLDQPGHPVRFKFRANGSWTRGALTGSVYYNFVKRYNDTLAETLVPIASWSTVDLTAQLNGDRLDSRLLHGFAATASVNNVFDRAPPVFRSDLYGLGYDPANANPLGRVITLRVSERW